MPAHRLNPPPRPPAPTAVLWARVIAPVFLVIAYVVLRAVPGRNDYVGIPEVLGTATLIVGLFTIAAAAAVDLATRPAARVIAEHERNLTEETGELPRPVPRTPVTMLDSTDLLRIHGDLLATSGGNWPGRADVKSELLKRAYGGGPSTATLVDHGEITDQLFTHDYVPVHHTPPRGFRLVGDRGEGVNVELPAELGRDRTGQLFGGL